MIAALKRLAEVAPISTWALFGAGMSLSLMQIAIVLLLWLGRWSAPMERDQLKYIGIIAIMLALDLMAVIASLAKARIAAKGFGGTGFELGSSGIEPPATGMTVKTEVTKTP